MQPIAITPLIFTDLDGSLLDHYDYSFAAALPLLKKLAGTGIPVIPNTSKTKAELLDIRKALGSTDPFIVENGGAVYLPHSSPLAGNPELEQRGELYCKPFTQPRAYWLDKLDNLAPELQSLFQSFSEMCVEELAERTGLNLKEAELARQREFNEPLHWLGTEAEKENFIEQLTSGGGVVLQGGRFLHLGGHTSKAKAMKWLADAYRQQQPNQQFSTIALGDSYNDLDMLDRADYSVVIKSPVHPYPVLKKKEGVYYTENTGTTGWVEGIEYHFRNLKIKL